MDKTELLEEALKLPAEERLELAELLWESVDPLPLQDWQKKLLEERLEEARQNPEDSLTWEEVRESLKDVLRRE